MYYEISIPYCAIKSKFENYIQIYFKIFQFIMVRLKANRVYANRMGNGFQFLMVRLKGNKKIKR